MTDGPKATGQDTGGVYALLELSGEPPPRLLAHALRERIEPLGVVPGQFAQLLALYEQDGLTQAELCARVQIEQFTMANPLSRMERDGLVDRVPDPADRRRSPVRLTPRARELEGELAVAARAVNAATPTDSTNVRSPSSWRRWPRSSTTSTPRGTAPTERIAWSPHGDFHDALVSPCDGPSARRSPPAASAGRCRSSR